MENKKIAILGQGVTAHSVRKYCAKNCIDSVEPHEADLVISSPGISPKDYPKVDCPIISELEWAYRLFQESSCPPKLIAVTGTNGKSSVTSMISHILDIPYAGNIGIPLIDFIGLEYEFPTIVVEVSSFQSESFIDFTPDVGVFLNISPDHLSRHRTLKEYAKQKAKCFQNQNPEHVLIYNAEDDYVESLCQDSLAETLPFSSQDINSDVTQFEHCPGKHNHLNILAALNVAKCLGYSIPSCLNAMVHYKPLKHRLEFVSTIDGRRIYNDSKATNPDASINALHAFDEKPIVILCGEDKKLDLTDCLLELIKQAKAIIVFGDMSNKVCLECQRINNEFPVCPVNDIEQAVEKSFNLSRSGDVILFSPASSSLDQFKNFEDRGNTFVTAVANYANTLLV